MEISLFTASSFWYLLPVIFCSAMGAYFLYYRKKNRFSDLKKWQFNLLVLLRFLAFFLLLALLIEPKIKHTETIKNKPVFIFAQDNSASIRLGKDSLYYMNEYPLQIKKLLKKIEENFELKALSFGQNVSPLSHFDYAQPYTNFSSLSNYIGNNYEALKHVQILLATDGLYNIGANPRYEMPDLGMPIHCLQLGDTSEVKDLSLYSLKANSISYANAKFPLKVGMKASNLKNDKFTLQIRNQSKLIFREEILITSDRFYLEKEYFPEIKQMGLQKFIVELKPDFEETFLQNNKDEFAVDVLNSKRSIAICFDQYHPDLAAIKSAIQESPDFDCKLVHLAKNNLNLNDTDLLILYQLPSKNENHQNLLQKIQKEKIPSLFAIGPNSDLEAINSLGLGVRLSSANWNNQDSEYRKNPNFSLFDLHRNPENKFENLPPLSAFYGHVNFDAEFDVLAFHSLRKTSKEYPLIAFTFQNETKRAWLFAEGVWRWKLTEYQNLGVNQGFSDLWKKMIRYLALHEKKNRLIIKHQNEYFEGNPISMQAEVYNKSYQPINHLQLNFTATNEKGKPYYYEFNSNESTYDLTIHDLPNGKYRYKAETVGLDSNLSQSGAFMLRRKDVESRKLRANSMLLQQISEASGGSYFQKIEPENMLKHFTNHANYKPKLQDGVHYRNVIEFMHLLIIISILMGLEWFLKKYWLGR